jgi:hypothetical protein
VIKNDLHPGAQRAYLLPEMALELHAASKPAPETLSNTHVRHFEGRRAAGKIHIRHVKADGRDTTRPLDKLAVCDRATATIATIDKWLWIR